MVEVFQRVGVVFVDSIDEVPTGRPIMLSAHGSAPEVVAGAEERAAVMVDAVCPLVTKVHHQVRRMAGQGYDIIYVGHQGHDEAIGAVAEAPEAVSLVDPRVGLSGFTPADPSKVALLAQTTLGLSSGRVSSATRPSGTPSCGRHAAATSATPPPTARTRSHVWRNGAIWCWWWARRTRRTPRRWCG